MFLNPQHPGIQDAPAFFLSLAIALEQMHASNEPHGSVLSIRCTDWLNEDGSFSAEKFQAARASSEMLPKDVNLQAFDVSCYVDLAISHLTGPTAAASDQPFNAEFHLGKGWPDLFLRLLESISQTVEQPSLTTMAELSSALQEPSPSAEAVHEVPDPLLFEGPQPMSNTVGHTAPPPSEQLPSKAAIRIALRNATVGKPYSYESGKIAAAIAAQFGDDPAQAYISHLQLPEDCGLFFDAATGSLSGVPTRPFDKELSLHYCASRSASGVAAKVTLLINPDPASLWKDVPQPADAPYQKPTLDHREEIHGPYRIVAASRRGRSHAQKGEFRDDDYAFGYAGETGWLVVVVADGAGSATYSRRGSQIACAVAKQRLIAVLNSTHYNIAEALHVQHQDWEHAEVKIALRQILYEAALSAHHKLRAEVSQPAEILPNNATLRNYDTTLILLVMKKVGEGCIAATFAIGDGGAGIFPHADSGMPLTHADSGEHAGQTIFLTFDSTVANTEKNLENRFRFVQTKEFIGALAMTDGITDPKFPSDAAFADPAQWAALWRELQPSLTDSQALLDWMNFFSPGNHDDRTLVAILPAQSAAPDTP
jgi:hypothetical protein